MATAGLALRGYEYMLPVIDRIVRGDSPEAIAPLTIHETSRCNLNASRMNDLVCQITGCAMTVRNEPKAFTRLFVSLGNCVWKNASRNTGERT